MQSQQQLHAYLSNTGGSPSRNSKKLMVPMESSLTYPLLTEEDNEIENLVGISQSPLTRALMYGCNTTEEDARKNQPVH